jgi:hypothetical protein
VVTRKNLRVDKSDAMTSQWLILLGMQHLNCHKICIEHAERASGEATGEVTEKIHASKKHQRKDIFSRVSADELANSVEIS